MDREAWQATVHGAATVGHDQLLTKPPPVLASFGHMRKNSFSKIPFP